MDKLSAWMDGELDHGLVAAELRRVEQDAPSRERWDTFHLIGDALRGEPVLSPDFQRRVNKRLADEPTVLAPRRLQYPSVARYALPVAASFAAVAVVGWVALSSNGTAPGVAQSNVAQAPAPVVLQAPAPTLNVPVVNVPDNGRMHEYLLAHMGVSPSTALQGLAPYIHTVTVQHPPEGR